MKQIEADRIALQQIPSGTAVEVELKSRIDAEQAAREKLSLVSISEQRTLWPEIMRLDRENTEFIKANVLIDGWPQLSVQGRDFAKAVFLIVQHSPEIELMKKALNEMEALDKSEVILADYALLYDRIAMLENRPQRYGSQLTCVNGIFTFHPIEDRGNVESRRSEVGLSRTLSEYSEHFVRFGEAC